MTEPAYLTEIRTSYDTVAVSYAELVRTALGESPFVRAMLAAFAELVPDGGLVADVGCGPGHVTARLRSLGLDASGVDLSPGMIDVARRDHPGLRFEVGTMTALARADGELAGVVACHSVIHLPPDVLPVVFAEFHRVLEPGGHVLVSFHVGDARRRKTKGYGGHDMALDVFWLRPGRIAALAAEAGFVVHADLISELDSERGVPQACLILRKPG